MYGHIINLEEAFFRLKSPSNIGREYEDPITKRGCCSNIDWFPLWLLVIKNHGYACSAYPS